MPMPDKPNQEQPKTYFMPDRASNDERIRLHTQDQMITASMGGVLPELPDPSNFQYLLDVGCGTGSWLIEAAKTYPQQPDFVATWNMLTAWGTKPQD